MIDGKIFFDQPVWNDKVIYENIRNIATGQGDDYTTGFLLDYSYFKDYYKMISVEWRKQQINFTANLDRAGNTIFCSILEEAKEIVFEFSQGTVKVLWMQYHKEI